jgi:hypothetical protein
MIWFAAMKSIDELGDALVFGAAHLHAPSLRVKRTNIAMYELMIQGRPWRRLDASPPPHPNLWATISNGEGRQVRGRGWDGGARRILRGLVEKMAGGADERRKRREMTLIRCNR